MFGYIRPFRPEMKCKDFDLYNATYCGLCHCLRQRYGWVAPMFLTYDFTFLALLLWEPESTFAPCQGRCHANPFRRKPMCQNSAALELAADESVILTYWKLKDAVQDDKGWKRAAAGLLAVSLRPAYGKAKKLRPAFDQNVQTCLKRLTILEKENCTSLDRAADTFAQLLCAAAEEHRDKRILEQLLYHVGRWIYLVDAQDDLQEDQQAGRYNPILARYGSNRDSEALELTLSHSLELAGAAFQLGEFGCRAPVLENILYLGLPLIQKAVFNGSWAQLKKQKVWSRN